MKKLKLHYLLLLTMFLMIGCNHFYARHQPGVIIKKTVSTRPVYENEVYYEEDVIIEERSEIWIGTTIMIGHTHCYWCDFCGIWHPRCTHGFCYCAPVVHRHYGFYSHGHYYDHCYHWTYEPYYVPQISTYRFKTNSGYMSYDIAEQKRKSAKGGVGLTNEKRVRYRGKTENSFTYDPAKVTKESRKNNAVVNIQRSKNDNVQNRTDITKKSGNTQVQKNIKKNTGNVTKGTGQKKAEIRKNTGNTSVQKKSGNISNIKNSGSKTTSKSTQVKKSGGFLSKLGSAISKSAKISLPKVSTKKGASNQNSKTGTRVKKSGSGSTSKTKSTKVIKKKGANK
ncbi:hypothetical protein ACFL5P_01305 [candidate division KSB1 bacterium]